MATKRISQTGMADSLVKFERNKKLLGGKGALGIEATAPKDPALAFILANNKPFPACACASRIPNSLAASRIEAPLRGA